MTCFSGTILGTILSRRSRLSRTSRAHSQLIRPRPTDCDRGSELTVTTFPFFAHFWFEHCQKRFLCRILYLVLILIYNPKEAGYAKMCILLPKVSRGSKSVLFGWFCLQARLAKNGFFFGHLFFNITNVLCAKRRVGHACICPRMVTA